MVKKLNINKDYLKYVNSKFIFKIILVYTMFFIPIAVMFYYFLPWILDYPVETVGNYFQKELEGTLYFYQYIMIMLLSYIIAIIIFLVFYKNLYKYNSYSKEDDNFKLKEKLIRFPTQIYIYQIIIPILTLSILHPISIKGINIATLKLLLVMGPMIIFVATFIYIYTKSLVSNILQKISDGNEEYKNRENILSKGLKEIFPVFFTLLILITMLCYSLYIKDRGKLINNIYSEKFSSKFLEVNYDNIDIIIKKLVSIEKNEKSDNFFYYDLSNDNYYFIDGNNTKLTPYFIKYMKELSDKNDGLVHDYYGNNYQGYVKKIFINNKEYYIGVKYKTGDNGAILLLSLGIIIIIIIYLIIFVNYSNFNRSMFKFLLDKFKNIESKHGENGDIVSIPIISNDEFGELTLLYNRLNVLTNNYIDNLKTKQDIIVKQGQLSSIGELAGGMAHDINTPIAAIKTSIVMFRDMLGKRTPDEMEILQNMDNCADKIIKIVNSVRNQIRNLGSDQNIDFKISDVINDIKIMAFNELSKHHCELISDIEDDIVVTGDPTKFSQVITNLVVNAIQAYDEKGGKVIVKVMKAPNDTILITVTDFAGGIPDEIKPYIFKNILTTKGITGTGLGLYLAYSVIKGVFKGDITFESEKNNGTTFYITIPKKISQ